MNWLTNFIRPKIRSFVQQKEVPDNLWNKCPSCEGMLFNKDLKENHNVCSHCSYHLRIPIEERLEILFDNSEYKLLQSPKNIVSDPLKFKDRKRYVDRIKEAQSKSNSKDAILVAKGTIGDLPVIIAAFDFSFMGGSMGAAVGEGIVYAAEQAIKHNAALIAIPSSGGARMQEGMVSLMQMPRSIVAVEMVKDKGLPYIVLLTDPTTGGVSASFAMVGDIHIAEPGCMIGFAGKRVIQETIREELPDDFQTAEYLQEHGMVDLVVHRHELKATIARIVQLLMNPFTSEEKVGTSKNNKKNKKNRGKNLSPNQDNPVSPSSKLIENKTPANKNDPKQKKSPVGK
jgi:acetyl-CoA carboxylase carboxyl transferase subunit beta